jgi:hypothetical protein
MSAPRFWLLAAMAWCLLAAGGCTTTPREYWQALKGEGFPEWSESMGASARGDSSTAKPSGFFTDRKSEQIEQHLGGGF